MRKLSDFPLYTVASNDDLLLIWNSQKQVTSAIKKLDLVGSGSGGGSGLANWVFVNDNYVATAGERLLIDTSSSSWALTLPSSPMLGNEIEICGVKGLEVNPLNLVIGQSLIYGAQAELIRYSSLYLPTKLIYTSPEIGWISTNNLFKASGAYSGEILNDKPYVYLRLNELSGTAAIDSSDNKLTCNYFGSPTFQQESSLPKEPNNKSVMFNGSTRIIVEPQISAPNILTLECKFKTTVANGGLFGFYGGGYDKDLYLINGNLRFLNYNGSTITTTKTYNDNLWHIVTAFVAPRGAQIWVDGALAASSTNPNTQIYDGKWYVGWGQYGGYFNGLIDEASITHKEISETRIKTRHSASV